MPETTSSDVALAGVDRAALFLAVVAGALTIIGTDGDWGPVNVFAGVLLVAMVLGFHRRVPGGTVRSLLMRLSFGLALSPALLILLAWPLELIADDSTVPLSAPAVLIYGVIGVTVALLEPAVSDLLEVKTRRTPAVTPITANGQAKEPST